MFECRPELTLTAAIAVFNRFQLDCYRPISKVTTGDHLADSAQQDRGGVDRFVVAIELADS